MPNVKTVAILGAGPGGLAAIKCCIDEGLRPTCFERQDKLGGVWYHTPDPLQAGRVCVAPMTTTNICKELLAYSDFLMPKHFPNFMHHSYILEYLHSYAANFDLEKNIKYNRDVTVVEPAADYDSTGRWTVAVKDLKTGEVETGTFDSVIVCVGWFTRPRWPDMPGLTSFKGQVFHAGEHIDVSIYKGKRVVVVGMGNSGCDVAVDASRVASKVFVATKRGEWLADRFDDDGLPMDMTVFRRANKGPFGSPPKPKFDHNIYRLTPKKAYVDGRLTMSGELQSRILCGYVTVKAGAVNVTESNVQFNDGSSEEDIDVIVCATGYDYHFPALEDNTRLQGSGSDKGVFLLYRYMFPPSQKHPTLAVVGVCPVLSPVFPKLEMQCRWATRVFKGLCRLPDSKQMLREIDGQYSHIVDHLTYMDILATDVGCKPNIVKLLLTDPRLGWRCYFGPATAPQFRLTGPHKWDGARDAIFGVRERVLYPLNTRPIPEEVSSSGHRYSTLLMTVAPLLAMAAYGLRWWQNNY